MWILKLQSHSHCIDTNPQRISCSQQFSMFTDCSCKVINIVTVFKYASCCRKFLPIITSYTLRFLCDVYCVPCKKLPEYNFIYLAGKRKKKRWMQLDFILRHSETNSPVFWGKCQTCYQSLAECEVSRLFDVLNMRSDHRTKQLSASSTCQKQSTPITIEFLSYMYLLCRRWGVLQYRSVNTDFRRYSKINITGFSCLHQKAADDRLQTHSRHAPFVQTALRSGHGV